MVGTVFAAQGEGIAARRHCLGLQRLDRPAVAHLVGHHPLHVILQPQDIHHRQLATADTLEAEAAVIQAVLAPGGALLPVDRAWLNAQAGAAAQVVILEQDGIRAGGHHIHPKPRGSPQFHINPLGRQGGLSRHRPVPGGIIADPGVIHTADAGHKPTRICGRRPLGLGEGAVGPWQLQMVLSHRDGGHGRRMIAGVAIVAAIVYIHGLCHGDGGLAGGPQLHEAVGGVVIPEAVAAPLLIQKVEPFYGPGTVVEADPDYTLTGAGGGGGSAPPRRSEQKGGRQAQRCNLHEFSLHRVLHFSTSNGNAKLTL